MWFIVKAICYGKSPDVQFFTSQKNRFRFLSTTNDGVLPTTTGDEGGSREWFRGSVANLSSKPPRNPERICKWGISLLWRDSLLSFDFSSFLLNWRTFVPGSQFVRFIFDLFLPSVGHHYSHPCHDLIIACECRNVPSILHQNGLSSDCHRTHIQIVCEWNTSIQSPSACAHIVVFSSHHALGWRGMVFIRLFPGKSIGTSNSQLCPTLVKG